jgi:hypothetical protein
MKLTTKLIKVTKMATIAILAIITKTITVASSDGYLFLKLSKSLSNWQLLVRQNFTTKIGVWQ